MYFSYWNTAYSFQALFFCVWDRGLIRFISTTILELLTTYGKVGVNLVPGDKPSHSDREARHDGRRIHFSILALFVFINPFSFFFFFPQKMLK